MLWQIRECCQFVQKEIERKSQQELKHLGFAKIDAVLAYACVESQAVVMVF